MKDPHLGVAKLDGTNSAQQAWWEKHAGAMGDSFSQKLQRAATGEGGGDSSFQEVLDKHLGELDALRVQMPSADEFRLPHIKQLTGVTKPNPVHDAFVPGPPLAAPEEPSTPRFIHESFEARGQRRRGRFLGSRQREDAPSREKAYENVGAGKQPYEVVGQARPSSWIEESDDSGDEQPAASSSRGGRRSARQRRPQPDPAEDAGQLGADDGAAVVDEDSMEPLRYCGLGELWSTHGASWVEFNRCVVPGAYPATFREGRVMGDTMEAYAHTKMAASLFDVSYKVGLRITGGDREFVADQFLTCNLREMRSGDVQYACILDSRGLILDDAFVFLTPDAVEILASGCHSRQLMEYLGQYVVYVRRSGADVGCVPSPQTAVLALQGPQARSALQRALEVLGSTSRPVQLRTSHEEDEVVLSPSVLQHMPFMSFLTLRCAHGHGSQHEDSATVLCAGTTGEDGFEIVGPEGQFLERLARVLLQDSSVVRPAGVLCLDVLRMEAGLPRVGSDIPVGRVTPVRASLTWTLDQSKMRNHLMFGWENLFFQLAKGPRFRRVGLLIDGPAHTGCRLLSNPHRQPVGEITSVAWSPGLSSRVAQAYVKPEYAKANKHVLVTVPYNLPTHKMMRRAIKRWTRAGPLRSAYRRLVPACVVPLPLVPHRYPEPPAQKEQLASARKKPFSQAAAAALAAPPASPQAATPMPGRVRGRGAAEPRPQGQPPDLAQAPSPDLVQEARHTSDLKVL